MKTTAIVTGLSRGIGKKIALSLAQSGNNIVINDNRNADEAEQVLSQIRNLGAEAVAVKTVLQKSKGAANLFDAALVFSAELGVWLIMPVL